MEELEHSLFIVEFVNKILSKPLSSLFALVGIEVTNPEHLIPDYVVMSLIAAGLLILFFSLSSRKPQLIPSKLQNVMELIIQFFENLLTDLIGKDGKKYLPLVGTIGLFILVCNTGTFPAPSPLSNRVSSGPFVGPRQRKTQSEITPTPAILNREFEHRLSRPE